MGYCRSSARSPCRNCSIELGCEDEDGYKAGESREGMTRRWVVSGGDEASCCWMLCSIDGKGDVELVVGRGIEM